MDVRIDLTSNAGRLDAWQLINKNVTRDKIKEVADAFLPDRQLVFNYYYLDGLSVPEIAGKLKKSESVVRQHQRRSIFTLVQHFYPHLL